MPEQSAQELPNALKQTTEGRLRRRSWPRSLVVTLAVLLVLTGVQVGVRVLPPDAVQVTASSAASGQTLGTATVTDTGTVADWSARINSLPAIPLLYNCSGDPPVPHAVTVKLDFLRWGLPIEIATHSETSCAWDVSQGVIPSARDDPTGQTTAILSGVRTLLPTVTWP